MQPIRHDEIHFAASLGGGSGPVGAASHKGPDAQAKTRVEIRSAADIATARQSARTLAIDLGFSGSDLTSISTAVFEIACNIVTHAKRGEVVLTSMVLGAKHGICVVARDEGPGITDLNGAMQHGSSTRGTLGVGLPGAKSLMDDFEIETKVGKGTAVTMKKWLP